MKKIYAIPLTLVSVTAAAFAGSSILPETDSLVSAPQVTESPTLGHDYEYAFTLPEISGTKRLVVKLPELASLDPVALFSDDSGERIFYEFPEVRNTRELVYKNLRSGSYHLGYTAFSKNALLGEKDVFIEE